MVNTFLVCSDFEQSAKQLDNARLGKQRVEAVQIYDIIRHLHILSQLFNSTLPTNPYLGHEWIRSIAKQYNSMDSRLLFRNNEWSWVPKNIKMIRAGSVKKTTQIDKNNILQQGEDYISLGFVYHPAVLAWLCYKEALSYYINVHIDEWVNRGFTNTIAKYEVNPDNIVRPPWCYDMFFHNRHKSNLLNKEITRNEKPWYTLKEDFVAIGTSLEYFWPYTPKTSNGLDDSTKRYENIDITDKKIKLFYKLNLN
jgi:hypothetical protein